MRAPACCICTWCWLSEHQCIPHGGFKNISASNLIQKYGVARAQDALFKFPPDQLTIIF